MTRLAKLIVAGMLALGAASPALAADLIAVNVEDPGACADGKVLDRITHRFSHQVRHVPHLPQVDITDFRRIRENRYQPQRADRPIERRYCRAVAALSDGRQRDIWYLIERPMGFAGIGSSVEFCVDGFDRWMVYNGRCRVVR